MIKYFVRRISTERKSSYSSWEIEFELFLILNILLLFLFRLHADYQLKKSIAVQGEHVCL